MKRSILLSLFILSVFVISGCGKYQDKLDEIKEKTGYSECIKDYEKKEKDIRSCINGKLSLSGYADNIDCIKEFENKLCENIDRYNSEVNASNDCSKSIKGPSEMECAMLLK